MKHKNLEERVMKLTRQITLRVLLELCDPLVEVLLLLLAVLQRSSLQLRVVSLYSRISSARISAIKKQSDSSAWIKESPLESEARKLTMNNSSSVGET
jgi:hypothetical protein